MSIAHEEHPDLLHMWDIQADPKGEGRGTKMMNLLRGYSDATGKPLRVSRVINEPFFDRFPYLSREPQRNDDPWYTYTPPGAAQGLQGTSSQHGLCPTCGDPLGGAHGTFCPRCSWSENDANLDFDPLTNPPDPTKDLHLGIQSKWFEAIEDSP